MVSSKPTDIPTALRELSRLQAHCVCLSVIIEDVVNLGRERGMGTWEELEVGTREVGMLYLCIKFSKHDFLETLEKMNA